MPIIIINFLYKIFINMLIIKKVKVVVVQNQSSKDDYVFILKLIFGFISLIWVRHKFAVIFLCSVTIIYFIIIIICITKINLYKEIF